MIWSWNSADNYFLHLASRTMTFWDPFPKLGATLSIHSRLWLIFKTRWVLVHTGKSETSSACWSLLGIGHGPECQVDAGLDVDTVGICLIPKKTNCPSQLVLTLLMASMSGLFPFLCGLMRLSFMQLLLESNAEVPKVLVRSQLWDCWSLRLTCYPHWPSESKAGYFSSLLSHTKGKRNTEPPWGWWKVILC